ncbi:MAG: MBL fold metallo-hydrolase [Methanothrix sp.]|jgi:glyoxylase-like metal-dependent hydrolase (beta-lactamase superfamily II)
MAERIDRYIKNAGLASSEGIIADYLREMCRGTEEISRLFLTHGHPDHIGAAKAIKDLSGCSVAPHPADKDWIEKTPPARERATRPGLQGSGGCLSPDRRDPSGWNFLDLGDGLKIEVLHTPGQIT